MERPSGGRIYIIWSARLAGSGRGKAHDRRPVIFAGAGGDAGGRPRQPVPAGRVGVDGARRARGTHRCGNGAANAGRRRYRLYRWRAKAPGNRANLFGPAHGLEAAVLHPFGDGVDSRQNIPNRRPRRKAIAARRIAVAARALDAGTAAEPRPGGRRFGDNALDRAQGACRDTISVSDH